MAKDPIIGIINLDLVPPEFVRTFERRNGKEGASIQWVLYQREAPDKLGNTHTLCVFKDAEARAKYPNPIYIGSGKFAQGMFISDSGRQSSRPQKPSDDDDQPF